jgi:competence protein ComEC
MKKFLPLILVVLLLFACGNKSKNRTSSSTDYKYIGSINSNKYHYTYCEWAQKIKVENAVYFKDKKEAEKAGYIPCKVCKP